MEENRIDINEEPMEEVQETTPYVPRPLWQRIAAWIGFAIVILGVVIYYYNIARGGM